MFHELLNQHPFLFYGLFTLISLSLGSFFNVVIYRLPRMLEQEWHEDCCKLFDCEPKKTKKVNLFFPRSFCSSCHAMVKAWQNIPLISFLMLRGRCAQCGEKISWRYPLVELSTLILYLIALWSFGLTAQLVFACLFISFMMCCFFIDLKHQILPDSLTLSLVWLGLIANSFDLFTSLHDAVYSAVFAYLVLWLLIKLFYLCRGKIGMGNGDFKLFAAFGAWFGWKFLPFILLFSSLVGAFVGLLYLYFNNKSKDTLIPFGPFLCAAGLVVLFWGDALLQWYLALWIKT